MSTVPASVTQTEVRERSRSAWLYSVPMWAGLAIVAMWLAVLFIGLFGGDIVSNTAGGAGTASSVPSVVAVVPFAFIATLCLGHWGFRRR
jgi:hypothetical protein